MSRFNEDFTRLTLLKHSDRGELYLVKSNLDKKEYVVRKTKSVSDKLAENVKRELRTVADFEHPHILGYKFYWTEPSESNEKYFYIQMKNCKENLKTWFANHPVPSDSKKQLKILYGIVSAVDYLHRRQYMHRNIKPDNIFFLDGQVMLGDFGSVRDSTQDLHTDLSKQDPTYRCPELLKTRQYTEKVDIYALGVVFFEMLSPVHYFSSCEQGVAVENAKKLQFPDFRQDMHLETSLLSRMLAADAAARPSTADIIKHQLFDVIRKPRMSGSFKTPLPQEK